MPLPADYITNRGVVTRGGRRVSPSAIVHDSFVDPPILDADGISVAHLGSAVAGTTNQVIGGALASGGVARLVPSRNVVITVTHATAVVAMSGVITGLDRSGNVMTEAWSVTAGGTSKVFTGKKAFVAVTAITEVVAASAVGNTITSGTGVVLGLSSPVSVASAVKERVNGSVVTTGTLVAASLVATDDPMGTYAPATAPDGSNDYDVWYISDRPEDGI